MDNKLQQLADKLYTEGLAKGEAKAAELIAAAEAKSKAIIDTAHSEAAAIKAQATSEAAELTRHTASEIAFSAQQAVAALKQQILDLISARLVDQPVTKMLDDPGLFCDMVKIALAGLATAGINDVMLLIPESKKESLEKSLQSSLHGALQAGLTIKPAGALHSGFQIGPRDGRYKVSFTDEDFAGFFKAYLRPRARALLFGV